VKALSENRILIVDDAKTNIDILVEALRHEYKLSVALDGAAALRSVKENAPDLVLLDIVMPGVDGYEVCRRIRSLPGGGRIAVLATTGWGQQADRMRSHESGFDAHLVKPVDPSALQAEMERATRARR